MSKKRAEGFPRWMRDECPKCGDGYPWTDLRWCFSHVKNSDQATDILQLFFEDVDLKASDLDAGEHVWLCLNCLHIWVDKLDEKSELLPPLYERDLTVVIKRGEIE